MAEVISYVNTASTPGGDGTTSATSGANRAYASLSEWEAAEQTDLVTAGDYHRVICIGGALSDNVTVAGWTTGENNCIIIEVDSGSAHGGGVRGGFYLEKSLGFAALVNISQNWTIAQGLDVVNTHPSGRAIDATVTGTNRVILSKCIGQGVSAFYSAGGDNVLLVNCIALDSSTGFRFANWSSQYGYNCGAFNCTTGFTRGGTNGATKATLKNCVAFGCTTPYSTPLASYWKTADCSNNATDAAVTTDVPGSSALANVVSGDFTDSANDDWSLSSGSALAESGADLTTAFGSWDRTVFTLAEEDILGNARPQSSSWDIGPFELVSGGGGVNVNITATEQEDTSTVNLSISNSLNLLATEQDDISSFSLSVPADNNINITATENQDASSVALAIVHATTVQAVEAADTSAINLAQVHDLGVSASEGNDTSTATLTVDHQANISATEGADTSSITLSRGHLALIQATEGADTSSITLEQDHQLNISATEGADTSSITLDVAGAGNTLNILATEGNDTSSVTLSRGHLALVQATESDDTSNITLSRGHLALIQATEVADTLSMAITVPETQQNTPGFAQDIGIEHISKRRKRLRDEEEERRAKQVEATEQTKLQPSDAENESSATEDKKQPIKRKQLELTRKRADRVELIASAIESKMERDAKLRAIQQDDEEIALMLSAALELAA